MDNKIGELKNEYSPGTASFPVEALKGGITLETIKWAHGFGEYLASKLTTSQLRKFFGELRRIEAESKSEYAGQLLMLIPKLAYAVGRSKQEKNKGIRIDDFYKELSLGISKVTDYDEFKNFIKIVEAIVAYHKVYESSSSNSQQSWQHSVRK
jgi:CRISPR-associated protein Csm2